MTNYKPVEKLPINLRKRLLSKMRTIVLQEGGMLVLKEKLEDLWITLQRKEIEKIKKRMTKIGNFDKIYLNSVFSKYIKGELKSEKENFKFNFNIYVSRNIIYINRVW